MSEPKDLVRTIIDEGVRDPRLLDALRAVPRAGFVPTSLAEQAYEALPTDRLADIVLNAMNYYEQRDGRIDSDGLT